MVEEDRARRALPVPRLRGLLEPTVGEIVGGRSAGAAVARLTDFGETAAGRDGPRRHRARVLSIAGPGVQAERDTATAVRNARECQRFSRARSRTSGPTAIPASRICRCRIRRRGRARTLHARAQVLRRHDQRPHQRPVSRPSVARSVLGARRGAGRADLSASDRSGDAGARRSTATRACAAPPGNGASRPARTRCAWSSAACSTASRARGSRSAISARRCRSCCGASTAAPGRFYGVQARKSRRRTTSRRTSW